MTDPIISCKDVGVWYTVHHYKMDSMKEALLKGFGYGRGNAYTLWALKQVSLDVYRGEVLGIIGENGSGKTTLLKVMGGILRPDEGEVSIKGNVSAILQLGVGFQRELTGRENVYINAALLGIPEAVIAEKMDAIIAFAELESFIDMPLKTYSSGMEMRLGFSIAVHVDPDILLIDEVLVIGDESFQKKCMRIIKAFKERGKTIIVVSHSMKLIGGLCDRVMLLDHGREVYTGSVRDGIQYYSRLCGDSKGIAMLCSEKEQIVFNNGRMYLFHGVRVIVPDPGMYYLLKGPCEQSTVDARWEIILCTETCIQAQGLCDDNTVLRWTIMSREEGGFSTHVEIVSSLYEYSIQMICIVDERYKQWFCNRHSGTFSAQSGDFEKNMYTSPYHIPMCFGVYPVSEVESTCPGIAMFMDDLHGEYPFCVLEKRTEHSGYSFVWGDSHTMPFRQLGAVFTCCYSMSDVDRAREIADRAVMIANDNIRVVFDTEGIRVWYCGRELSIGKGFYSAFLSQDRWYDAAQFQWKLKKESDFSARIQLFTKEVLVQEWIFTLEPHALQVESMIQSLESGALFSQAQMVLLMSPEYSQWMKNDEEGDISTYGDIKGQSSFTYRGEDDNSFFALVSYDQLPCVRLRVHSHAESYMIRVYRLYDSHDTCSVSVILPDSTNKAHLAITYEMMPLDALKRVRNEAMQTFRSMRMISREMLSLEWKKNGCSLSYDGSIISAGNGLGCYFVYDDVVYAMASFWWRVTKISSSEMKVQGHLKEGVLQVEITYAIMNDQRVNMKVRGVNGNADTTIRVQFFCEWETIYGEWWLNNMQGEFPLLTHEIREHIVPLPDLKEIIFFALSAGDHYPSIVVHTHKHMRIVLQNNREQLSSPVFRSCLISCADSDSKELLFCLRSRDHLQQERRLAYKGRSLQGSVCEIVGDGDGIRLWFHGSEVTCAPGISISFCSGATWYAYALFSWVYTTNGTDCLYGEGELLQENIKVRVVFQLRDDRVQVRVEEKSTVPRTTAIRVTFPVHADYKQWCHNMRTGSFRLVRKDEERSEYHFPGGDITHRFILLPLSQKLPMLCMSGDKNYPYRIEAYTLPDKESYAVSALMRKRNNALYECTYDLVDREKSGQVLNPDVLPGVFIEGPYRLWGEEGTVYISKGENIVAVEIQVNGTFNQHVFSKQRCWFSTVTHNNDRVVCQGTIAETAVPVVVTFAIREGIIQCGVHIEQTEAVVISDYMMLVKPLFVCNQWFCNDEEGNLEATHTEISGGKLCLLEEKEDVFIGLSRIDAVNPVAFCISAFSNPPEEVRFIQGISSQVCIVRWTSTCSLGALQSTCAWVILEKESVNYYVEQQREKRRQIREKEKSLQVIRSSQVELMVGQHMFLFRELAKTAADNYSIVVRLSIQGYVYKESRCSWQWKRVSNDTLTLRGDIKPYALSIEVQATVCKNEIHMTFDMYARQQTVYCEESAICCVLPAFFDAWVAGGSEGHFQELHGLEYDVLETPLAEKPPYMGVRTSQGNAIIIRDLSDPFFVIDIRNYAKEQAVRSVNVSASHLHLPQGTHRSVSFVIAVLTPEEVIRLITACQELYSIAGDELCVRFHFEKMSHRVRIEKAGIVYTADDGFYTIIKGNGKTYYSQRAVSTAMKRSSTEMEICNRYPCGEERIVWTIEEGKIRVSVAWYLSSSQEPWEVEVFFDMPSCFSLTSVVQEGAPIDCSAEVRSFMKIEGEFYGIFSSAEASRSPFSFHYTECAEGIFGEVESKRGRDVKTLKIKKTIIPSRSSFVGELIYSQQYPVRNRTADTGLGIWMKYAGMALLWNNMEFTKGMGLYSSYFSESRGWDDSIHHAERSCLLCTSDTLHFIVRWRQLPCEHLWRIHRIGERIFEWNISINYYGDMKCEMAQHSVLLHNAYAYWTYTSKKEKFTDEAYYTYQKGNALPVLPAASVVLTPEDTMGMLPAIRMAWLLPHTEWRLYIGNSEKVFGGRLVQCIQDKVCSYTSGMKEEIKGVLEIV